MAPYARVCSGADLGRQLDRLAGHTASTGVALSKGLSEVGSSRRVLLGCSRPRLHKLTTRLATTKATVVVEDFGVAAMAASANRSRR